MKSRIIAISLIFVMTAALLSGCGGQVKQKFMTNLEKGRQKAQKEATKTVNIDPKKSDVIEVNVNSANQTFEIAKIYLNALTVSSVDTAKWCIRIVGPAFASKKDVKMSLEQLDKIPKAEKYINPMQKRVTTFLKKYNINFLLKVNDNEAFLKVKDIKIDKEPYAFTIGLEKERESEK